MGMMFFVNNLFVFVVFTGPEQKITKDEKVGFIGGILAGVEEESSEEEEEQLLVPVQKTSVMQLEELSDSVETRNKHFV
jgi:hypothetical protein